MKRGGLVVLMMMFIYINGFSQSRFEAETGLGMLFQNKAIINGEETESKLGFGYRLGINYNIPIKNKTSLQTGLHFKYSRGKNETEEVDYNFWSTRLQIPFYLGYQINSNSKAFLGFSVENNKDFEETDFKAIQNFRFDFIAKYTYKLNNNLDLYAYFNTILNKVFESYTIVNPKQGIFVGVIYTPTQIFKETE